MRKITNNAVNAFNSCGNFRQSNTTVTTNGNITKMYLYDHLIAWKTGKKLYIDNCGYFTNTTKERLNGLPGVFICQKKGIWCLNGKQWNGTRKLIKL